MKTYNVKIIVDDNFSKNLDVRTEDKDSCLKQVLHTLSASECLDHPTTWKCEIIINEEGV